MIGNDPTRYVLCGVAICKDYLLASNGKALFAVAGAFWDAEPAIFPGSAVGILAEILEGEGVTFQIGGGRARASSSVGTMETRLIEGSYPYNGVLMMMRPGEDAAEFEVGRAETLAAMAAFRGMDRQRPMSLQVDEDGVKMECSERDGLHIEQRVSGGGRPLQFGVNPDFLTAALTGMKDDVQAVKWHDSRIYLQSGSRKVVIASMRQ